MFGHLVRAIDDDFVRYAMHAEVTVEVAPAQIQNLQLSSADESNIGGFGLDVGEMFAATAEPPQAVVSVGNDGVQRVEEQELNLQPIVKSEQEKTGRNEPCYCGSGKKFKACHGKNS
jgi:preprotein translocase subunit SecA